jgi:hypothetical protein
MSNLELALKTKDLVCYPEKCIAPDVEYFGKVWYLQRQCGKNAMLQ